MAEAKTAPVRATGVDDITKSRLIRGAFKSFSDSLSTGPTGLNYIALWPWLQAEFKRRLDAER